MIDAKNILDELGIDYKIGGKNVGSNDLNIDCPFCFSDKHLGISVHSGFVNCWVCEFEDAYDSMIVNGEAIKKRPGLVKVLMEASGESWKDIKEILERNGWEPFTTGKDSESGLTGKCKFPEGSYKFSKATPHRDKALRYLESRGFSLKTVDKYDLRLTEVGPYSHRIIIPVIIDGEMVCYTSRDYLGNQSRYKNAFLSSSKMRLRDTLYNYDAARHYKHAYLLEGPTDVWRMGDDSMGVFRSALSREQRNLLINSEIESLTIIFDYLATGRAYSAAEELSPFINRIKVVKLDGDNDVDELGRNRVLSIEKRTPLYRS